MTVLQWDQIGDRRFEAGVDRGVLYTLDGVAVPWNGLVSVTENTEREVKSYYLDGIKYLDHQVLGAYSGKLGAYTYPDELDTLLGQHDFAPGVILHDQRSQMFHLSYRTRVGNDLSGIDYGYKIHIVYNIQANPSSVSFGTIGDNPAPGLFEWSLTGTPSQMFGIYPTSHVSLHSLAIDPDTLVMLEDLIYGTSETDPSLPGLVDLMALVTP